MKVSVAYMLAVDLALADGVPTPLAAPWTRRVDGSWTVAMNPGPDDVRIEPPGSMGAVVPPYVLAVWFNGWLAGLLSPVGGTLAAGEAANEDTFIAALRAALNAEEAASTR